MTLTDEDRAGLSAEEIAAIETDDDSDLLAEIAGDDEDGSLSDSGSDKPAPQAADAAEEEEDEPKPAPAIAPAVDDFEARVKALKVEKRDAFQKLMDGEITAEEYAVVEERTGDQIADMTIRQKTHEADALRAQQTAQQEWQWECNRFMRETLKAEGMDYAKNRALGAALDAEVKALANDPKNGDKSGEWFLQEAHKAVKSAFGIKAAAAPAPAPARKPDLSSVPPSISRAPAAADARVADDEFAFMRNLSGDKYERAIAGMTAEQLDRFMSA